MRKNRKICLPIALLNEIIKSACNIIILCILSFMFNSCLYVRVCVSFDVYYIEIWLMMMCWYIHTNKRIVLFFSCKIISFFNLSSFYMLNFTWKLKIITSNHTDWKWNQLCKLLLTTSNLNNLFWKQFKFFKTSNK